MTNETEVVQSRKRWTPDADSFELTRLVTGPLFDKSDRRDDRPWWDRELRIAVGKRYQACGFDNFVVSCPEQRQALWLCRTYANDVDTHVETGNSLLLFGKIGTGKDHLAYAVARYAIYRGYSARWIRGLRWFSQMRDNIDAQTSELLTLNKLILPAILVLSDPLPPNGDLTAYQLSNLLQVIDSRYCERRPTVITVNLRNPADGQELFGPQVWDRLTHGATIVWCQWPSYRQQQSTSGSLKI
jgi:DNA replication protein DnaC